MNDSVLFWFGLFVVLVIIGGVIAWLYSEYQAGQNRAKAARLQRKSTPPLLPPSEPLPPAKGKRQPYIVFGKTYDPSSLGDPGSPPAQMATESRTCPVCRRSINAEDYTADRVIICPQCRTHVHVDCWEYSSNLCPNCGGR